VRQIRESGVAAQCTGVEDPVGGIILQPIRAIVSSEYLFIACNAFSDADASVYAVFSDCR